MGDWTPTSWQSRPAGQQPTYPEPEKLEVSLEQLATLPPLVTSWEVERLKSQLAEAAAGKRFLLQGGACAERFDQCSAETITNKLKILLQMSLVLTFGLKRRIIRVGRFAGQYAKPRSKDIEERDGVVLPTYRGDIVNGPDFTEEERRPDPERMLRGYHHSALTINFIRALVDGGFADLHHPEYWDLGFVSHSPRSQDYQRMVESISDSLRFMETLAGIQAGEISRVDFFTSHEGLLLPYETAQTRQVPRRDGWYNLGTHFPWIGMRTAELGGAHVEYYRGIRNPIAVKIGPSMTPEWLEELVEILDPDLCIECGACVRNCSEDALTVPRNALKRRDGRQFLRVRHDDKWVETAVRTGWRSESTVEILSGVNQGDVIEINSTRRTSE